MAGPTFAQASSFLLDHKRQLIGGFVLERLLKPHSFILNYFYRLYQQPWSQNFKLAAANFKLFKFITTIRPRVFKGSS